MDSIDCETSVEEEEECQFHDGGDVLDYYAQDESNFAFDLAMLGAMAVGLRVAAYLCIYFKARRRH